MKEQLTPFEQTVRQGADGVVNQIGADINPYKSDFHGSYDESGFRHNVYAHSSKDSVFAQIAKIDLSNPDDTFAFKSPDHAIAYGTAHNNGNHSANAKVSLRQGVYNANESHDYSGQHGGVSVNREGYGEVKLKNPKAKELIASLAAKAVSESIDKSSKTKAA